MARSHRNGWDYVAGDASPAIISWYENAGHAASFTLQGNGAWVPAYMGMYHVAQNDYQIAGWIPNKPWFQAAVSTLSQADEARWQRIQFVPVRKNLSADSVSSPLRVPTFNG